MKKEISSTDGRTTYYMGGKPYFGIPPIKKEATEKPETKAYSQKKAHSQTDKKKAQIKNPISPHKHYDAAYISFVENGESAAVFIARDIAKDIPTVGRWIDVLSTDGVKRKDGRWDFRVIVVELFQRKKKPVYPKDATEDDRKYITWKTANEDISKQRKHQIREPKYRIIPRLVNRSQEKAKPKWEYEILKVEKL